MRKLLLGLLCFLPFAAISETKPVDKIDASLLCYNTDELFKTLRKDYAESPILLGDTDDEAQSTMSFWSDKKGNSWTIVATKGKLSCVVGTGVNLKIVRKGTQV